MVEREKDFPEDEYTPSVIVSSSSYLPEPLSVSPSYSLMEHSMPLQPYWGPSYPSPAPLLLPPYPGLHPDYSPVLTPELPALAPTYCLPSLPGPDYQVTERYQIFTPPRDRPQRTSPSPRHSRRWQTLTRPCLGRSR